MTFAGVCSSPPARTVSLFYARRHKLELCDYYSFPLKLLSSQLRLFRINSKQKFDRCRVFALANSKANGRDNWVGQNAELLRSTPLVVGVCGVVSVLVNRVISGVAPVVDASSGQSRADVLVIVLSAMLVMTGMQWLALKPRKSEAVLLEGKEVWWLSDKLPREAAAEVQWVWSALRLATGCRSVVLLYGGRCLMQAGMAAVDCVPGSAVPGEICAQAMESGKGNYFANLAPYPGRVEFTSFLPDNTQALLVQPVGERGVLLVGADTQRAFSKLDQAWVATIGDKLDATLEAGVNSGFGGASAKAKASGKRQGVLHRQPK